MRRGLVEGLLAYFIWGLSPIFWKQLGAVAPLDIVAHRLVWTAVLLIGVQLARRSVKMLLRSTRDRRMVLAMGISASLLTANWLIYVWAIGDDRVLEASLGYFINPLVAVFLGVVVLGERLPATQWVAIGIAGLGVVWLTVDVGRLPWVSLALAFSFGVYGLIRKTARIEAFDGLTIEMSWLLVPAALWVIGRGLGGEPAAVADDPSLVLLLLATSLITAAPLLLFSSAARRIPLATVGLLQYVAPTLQFIIGVWVYDEAFDRGQLIGFGLIWAALIVFSVDIVRRHAFRPGRAAAPAFPATAATTADSR